METGDGLTKGEQEPGPQTQQLCRFFSQGRHCNFGKKCKFLHVRHEVGAEEADAETSQPNSEGPAAHGGQRPPATTIAGAGRRRPCRYFISGHCTMENRCRFWHPPQFPSVDDLPVGGRYTAPAQRKPVSRPGILQEAKLCDLTEEVAKELRDTEIKQLKKRFPKDQLIVQERSDGRVTYYRATVEATDPDWVRVGNRTENAEAFLI